MEFNITVRYSLSTEVRGKAREEGQFMWGQWCSTKALGSLLWAVGHHRRIINWEVTWLDSYPGRFTQLEMWTLHTNVDLLSHRAKWGILPSVKCFCVSPSNTTMWRDTSQKMVLGPLASELPKGCLLKRPIPRPYLILTELGYLHVVYISSWFCSDGFLCPEHSPFRFFFKIQLKHCFLEEVNPQSG